MSQKETAAPIADLERSESASENLSRLAELARQAYQQKRTKDCLDLTRAILLIDPDHAQAQSMRSALQSEMHRDLENAREFLRQAASKEAHEEEAQTAPTALPARENPWKKRCSYPVPVGGLDNSSTDDGYCASRWLPALRLFLPVCPGREPDRRLSKLRP